MQRNRWLHPFYDIDPGGGGGGGEDVVIPEWAGSLPDELKNDASLQGGWKSGKYQDLPSTVKSLLEMEKYQGQSVKLPGENATPEEMRKFFTKMGVPETIEGYEVKAPEGIELGEREQGLVDRFKQVAFEKGIPPKQFQSMVDSYFQMEAEDMKAWNENNDKAIETCVAELRKEWGPDFEKNTDMMLKAVEAWNLGGVLDAKGLSNSPELSKFFLEIGQAMEEGRLKGGATGYGGDDPEAELDRLLSDEEFMSKLMSKDYRVRKEAIARKNDLHKAIAQKMARQRQ